MSKPDTWMPLVIGDYMADTVHLSTAEHGGYLLLLMTAWMRGGTLPDDDAQLARIARASSREWKTLRAALAPFFHVADGEWRQKRLLKELAEATNRTAKSVARAEEASAAKWGDSAERGREMRSMRMTEARKKGTHTADQWERMRTFHENRCVRCNSSDAEIVRDHIIPVYQGGSDGIDNIQPMCRACNASKGPDRTDHRKPGWDACLDACLDASSAGNEMPPQSLHDACPPSIPEPPTSLRSVGRSVRSKPLATGIANDFAISERVQTWADRNGHAGVLQAALAIFVGRSKASGKTYTDWDQAFMNAVREDWYGLRVNGKAQSLPERRAATLDKVIGKENHRERERVIEGTAERVGATLVRALPDHLRKPG